MAAAPPPRPGPARAGPGPAPARPVPAWRRGLGEFGEGLVEPAPQAAPWMAAAFVAALAVAAWFFSPATLAGPWGAYLPRSAADAEGFVTRDVLALAATPATAPRLVVLGPSTLAQALGGEAELARALAAADPDGPPREVHMLTTPLQSPYDQVAIVEALLAARQPGDPPLTIALGLGLQRLGWTPERMAAFESEARLGLRSDWVDAEMVATGHAPRPRTGWWALDNRRLVIVNGTASLIRLALGRPAVRRVDSYGSGAPVPPADRPRAQVAAQAREGLANEAAFFDLHRRLAARIAAVPGARLVLLQEALAPDFIAAEGLGEAEAEAEAAFAAFAAEVGAPFWPIMDEAGLAAADYHDDLHVRAGAPQDRVRAALARHLAAAP